MAQRCDALHRRPRQLLQGQTRVAATPVDWKSHASAKEELADSLRADRANWRVSILELRDGLAHSFEENLRHHPFVFVIEKMAVKDGHALDHRVGEIHDYVNRAAVGNVYSVQPEWVGNWLVVFGVREEMNLVDVHRMQF